MSLALINQALAASLDFFRKKKFPEAEMLLDQTLRVDPNCIRALQLLGLIRHQQQQYQDAISLFNRALEADPNDPETNNNLGLSYSAIGDFKASTKHLERAVRLNPKAPHFHSNLGLQWRQQGQLAKAKVCFETALKLKEDSNTLLMLGGTHGECKNLDLAERYIEQALQLDPDNHSAHVDRAWVHFLKGEWMPGWREYEHRFEAFDQTRYWRNLYPQATQWDGYPLNGKRIILYSEQGSGDAIQFIRYASLVKQMGGYVIIHCSPDLQDLFGRLDSVDQITTAESPNIKLPPFDCHASLLSLPYLLGTPEIPSCPYIRTEKTINLGDYSNYFKIGIVWAGSPQHPNDARRSCHLKRFKSLHDLPGVKLFSLQKDVRPRMYRFAKRPINLSNAKDMQIVNLVDQIPTFAETSAVIKQMDLVISVDTSTLHLAGSMNHRAWGLIPYNPDWRWKLEGNTTEWYPSVRLFRQPKPKDWSSVFEAMTAELKKELDEHQRIESGVPATYH